MLVLELATPFLGSTLENGLQAVDTCTLLREVEVSVLLSKRFGDVSLDEI